MSEFKSIFQGKTLGKYYVTFLYNSTEETNSMNGEIKSARITAGANTVPVSTNFAIVAAFLKLSECNVFE